MTNDIIHPPATGAGIQPRADEDHDRLLSHIAKFPSSVKHSRCTSIQDRLTVRRGRKEVPTLQRGPTSRALCSCRGGGKQAGPWGRVQAVPQDAGTFVCSLFWAAWTQTDRLIPSIDRWVDWVVSNYQSIGHPSTGHVHGRLPLRSMLAFGSALQAPVIQQQPERGGCGFGVGAPEAAAAVGGDGRPALGLGLAAAPPEPTRR